MRVAMLTREFPPDVYGGAGVHVDYLSRELGGLVDLTVHCLGEPRPGAIAHSEADPRLAGANSALRIFAADLEMTAGVEGSDLVHSHTWYANLGGLLSKLLYDIPHVITAHSLEPLRPWKAEQLGGGYRLSSWAERTAYESCDAVIAVSTAMKQDVSTSYPSVDPKKIFVIHNGIDTEQYRPDPGTEIVEGLGVDLSRPYVVFVGRITRQKGVPLLLRAAAEFDDDIQLLLLAGAADTPELGREVTETVTRLQETRSGVIWIEEMLPRQSVIQALTHAAAFICPSVYEPQGIVNLEAMACETPVVASNVGGIPEVVMDDVTGLLLPYEKNNETDFSHQLGEAVNKLVRDPKRAREMGLAGRERAIESFGWEAIARQTATVYESVRERAARWV